MDGKVSFALSELISCISDLENKEPIRPVSGEEIRRMLWNMAKDKELLLHWFLMRLDLLEAAKSCGGRYVAV